LDRAVKATLPAIADADRKTDGEIADAFAAARPRLLGALPDLAVVGLKNYEDTHLTSLPRMASSAKWVTACETALPADAARFADCYAANGEDLASLARDNSPLAQALLCWIDASGNDAWAGTSGRLLTLLRTDCLFPTLMFGGRVSPRTPRSWAVT
jgi:hypothetical protein